MTQSLPIEMGPRATLGDAAVRRRLSAMIRRRVPRDDAEDLVQAVLCDALAAERIPADPGELSRWVATIARNKVADFHRRARRERAQELPELSVLPAPFEARALLDRVARDTPFDARARQALEWVVREHAGEQLSDIAREAALPSAQVRKRVSRLRARLRQTWLGDAAACALAMLVLGSAAAAWRIANEPVAIVAEPEATEGVAAAALEGLEGAWRVESLSADPSMDPALRALVEAEAASVRIQVVGRTLTVQRGSVGADRFLDVRAGEDGRVTLVIADGAGGRQEAEMERGAGGRLVLRSAAGRWKGTVTLVR